MAKSFDDIMSDARRVVPEVTTDDVKTRLAGNGKAVVLVDVREKEEYREGHLKNAISIPRGFLEMKMETEVPDRDAEIIAYCQTHHRSSHTYVVLRSLGYPRVRGYAGSWSEWGNRDDTPIEK